MEDLEVRRIIDRAPVGWNDVTVEIFQEMVSREEFENWLDSFQHYASILCNIDPDDLMEWSIDDARELYAKISWCINMPNMMPEPIVIIDDVIFNNIKDYGREIKLGQWADLETYCKDGEAVKNMHKMLAVLYKSEDGKLNVPQKAEIFKKARITDVYGTLVFFSIIANKYTPRCQAYFPTHSMEPTMMMKSQMKKLKQEQTEKLTNNTKVIGDGMN